ncbi:MAG: ParA family protein [Hyphomicrobium sp.]
MPVVVAFISQKGGVGKSTLARGLGAVVAHAGLKVRIADLDPQQHTVLQWEKTRRANSVAPTLDVKGYPSIHAALDDTADIELLIVDTPGRADQATLTIAENAHFVVQPTGPSLDDVYPGVLLFHELVAAGIGHERLTFALCRTQNDDEEDNARSYLEQAGFAVLPGAVPERTGYRNAQNRGRAINETSRRELNERADALIWDLMTRVAAEVKALREREKKKGKKGRKDAI